MRFLLVLSFLFVLNVHADQIDSSLAKCQAENSNTENSIACLLNATEKWDTRLNEIYKKVSVKLDAAQKSQLKQSQIEWIKFRDKEKEFIQNTYGKLQGSIYKQMQLQYIMDITKTRALQLEQYFKDIEAGTSGL